MTEKTSPQDGCEENGEGKQDVSAASIATLQLIFERQLREHEKREEEHIQRLFDRFGEEAFPDGATAHRAAHNAMIEAAKAEKEFWQGLKTEIAKKSLFGILRIIAVLAVAGLLAKFGLPAGSLAWLAK